MSFGDPSWQVIPDGLYDLVSRPDPARATAATQAMYGMRKIILADLESAAPSVCPVRVVTLGDMPGDDADPDVVYLRRAQPPVQVERIALVVGLIAGVVLAGLVGWLGFRTYEAQNRQAQRDLFVRTAEDVAVNLSTVDYQHADADAQRIADSATGGFADSFARRRQAYIDDATRTHTQLLGTVTDAGLESQNGDQGRVLVAATVRSADPRQEPRFLRMRVTVQKVGNGAKVSDVDFVS